MQVKQRYHYILAIILLCIITGFGIGGWVWSQNQVPRPSVSQALTTPLPSPTKPPVKPLDIRKGGTLIVPAIDLEAPVEPVGTDKLGRMAVPRKNVWENVGWYKYGPAPGQRGSAVIDGHLDRPGRVPAVFWNLHKLKVGDSVVVKDAHGRELRFQVYDIQTYTPDEAPLEKIFSDTSGMYLNLITCAGEWIPAQQQPSHRLVVYTKLKE